MSEIVLDILPAPEVVIEALVPSEETQTAIAIHRAEGNAHAIDSITGLQAKLDELQTAIAAIDEADLLNRANHTGTQPINTIDGLQTALDGLQTALDGKQPSLGYTPLNAANNLSDLGNAATARGHLGLGSAATQASNAFASAAQGAKADTALQPAAIGSTVQGYDEDLAAIAALTTTAFGRSALTLATAAEGRALFGLGTLSTQNANAVAITGGTALFSDVDVSALTASLDVASPAKAQVTILAAAGGTAAIEIKSYVGGNAYIDFGATNIDYHARILLNGTGDILIFTGDTNFKTFQFQKRVEIQQPIKFYDGTWEMRQGTKPTVRPDGTALGTGDRWLDTTDRLWWYWNGTYWLSETLFAGSNSFSAYGSSFGIALLPVNSSYDLWLERFAVTGWVAGTNDATNYWGIQLTRTSSSAETVINSALDTRGTTGFFNLSVTLGVHLAVSSLSVNSLRSNVVRNATPGNLNSTNFRVTFRLAKP